MARGLFPHGTLDLPGPGIKPASPAFLTTEPPGKPPRNVFNVIKLQQIK